MKVETIRVHAYSGDELSSWVWLKFCTDGPLIKRVEFLQVESSRGEFMQVETSRVEFMRGELSRGEFMQGEASRVEFLQVDSRQGESSRGE